LSRAKIGHLEDPHRSATLIVQVPTLSRGNSWEITGPGVKDSKTIQLGLTTNWDQVRAERNAEYPLGLDILVGRKGRKAHGPSPDHPNEEKVMAYVAVKGGQEAIEESLSRLKYQRLKKGSVLDVEQAEGGLRALIDQVMSEGSLYSRHIAALAIKQAEGSPEEAVFLMRAFRSTLPRKHYSFLVDTEEMLVERRISASFKDIPGGQILGASPDYSHRLIDFTLEKETGADAQDWLEWYQNRKIPRRNLSASLKWWSIFGPRV
jgi:hypothetical protein